MLILKTFFLISLAGAGEHRSDFANRLKYLSEINSGSFNQEGLEEVAIEISKDFRAAGISLDWNSEERSLSGSLGPDTAKRKVLLVGHLDTVFETFHPFQKVTIHQSKMHGPGVADAKSGLLLMAELIRQSSEPIKSGQLQWRVFISADEEIGSKYSKDGLVSFSKGVDAALIFEPGWFEQATSTVKIPSHLGGNLQLQIKVQTQESHSGTSAKQGRGPMDAAAKIILALGKLRSASVSINFYESEHKTKSNVAGGVSSLKASVRYEKLPEKMKVLNELKSLKRELARRNQTEMNWEEKDIWLPQQLSDPRLIGLWQKVYKESNLKTPQPAISLARSASSFLALNGVPVLDSVGLYGSGYHSDQEVVLLDSFHIRLELLKKLVAKIATL